MIWLVFCTAQSLNMTHSNASRFIGKPSCVIPSVIEGTSIVTVLICLLSLIIVQALSANLFPTLMSISEEVHGCHNIQVSDSPACPFWKSCTPSYSYDTHQLSSYLPPKTMSQLLSYPIVGLSSAGFFVLGTVHKCYAEDVISDASLHHFWGKWDSSPARWAFGHLWTLWEQR